MELKPDYWDVHNRLGYVLFLEGRYREATDVLEVAVAHDSSNRPLRRLLASAYADTCRFTKAKSLFDAAYRDAARADAEAEAAMHEPPTPPTTDVPHDRRIGILLDWGRVLAGFGFDGAALAQERNVVTHDPTNPEALMALGQIEMMTANGAAVQLEQGLRRLRTVLDNEHDKTTSTLAAVLAGYVQIRRPAEAVRRYADWSRLGLVPPPANPGVTEANRFSTDQRLRVMYAYALDAAQRKGDAENERELLKELGENVAIVTADMVAQAKGLVGDEEARVEVGSRDHSDMAFVPDPARNERCRMRPDGKPPHFDEVRLDQPAASNRT